MDHSRNHSLKAKHDLKERIMSAQLEQSICRNEKHHKINMILEYGNGLHTYDELAKKNLNRIREIYDREVG